MEQNPQSQLKLLVQRGKEQGYLTYAEVNDHLPEDIVDSDQIEDIIQMINDMGIQVMEEAPDADDLLLAETSNNTDEDAEEAAAQVLSSVESEIGRTTDPVRMYMREMGTVELLTREGEIDIALSASKTGSTRFSVPLPNTRKQSLICWNSTTALKLKKRVCLT
jgi:RNA polymerase primary sigma factor